MDKLYRMEVTVSCNQTVAAKNRKDAEMQAIFNFKELLRCDMVDLKITFITVE